MSAKIKSFFYSDGPVSDWADGRDRQKDRQTDRKIDRTDRETER